jgi:hypothetical protein
MRDTLRRDVHMLHADKAILQLEHHQLRLAGMTSFVPKLLRCVSIVFTDMFILFATVFIVRPRENGVSVLISFGVS